LLIEKIEEIIPKLKNQHVHPNPFEMPRNIKGRLSVKQVKEFCGVIPMRPPREGGLSLKEFKRRRLHELPPTLASNSMTPMTKPKPALTLA
jgi:hypothetical protein